MSFGNGWKHEDSSEMLEEGNYKAKIVKAELKNGNYGQYVQCEVEIEGISPRNLDSSLFFLQPRVSHDVLCIQVK